MNNPHIDKLISYFAKLPGIGTKTAERLVYHLAYEKKEFLEEFGNSLIELSQNIHFCKECGNIANSTLCEICLDQDKDQTIICVVEHPKNIISLEKLGVFNGKYHVLNGVISPLNGVDPDDLNIDSLFKRLENVKEILIATNATIEGEMTAQYIAKLVKKDIKVTRIAYGLPVGSDLEYADEITLQKAINARYEI